MPYAPDPVAFRMFDYPIYFYGIFMALAILVGYNVSCYVSKFFYKDIDPEIITELTPYLVVGALFGARFYYVIASWAYFHNHLGEILAFHHGGMSVHGAILGGLLVCVFYFKKKNISILKYLDILTYGVISGQIIGRFGNYFNQEAYGAPTELPWKIFIEPIKRPFGYEAWQYFHPTFLYEALLSLLILLFLFFVIRRFNPKAGVIFFLWLLLYSIVRIFTESIRLDSVLNIMGQPLAIWVSLFIIIVSCVSLIFITKKKV